MQLLIACADSFVLSSQFIYIYCDVAKEMIDLVYVWLTMYNAYQNLIVQRTMSIMNAYLYNNAADCANCKHFDCDRVHLVCNMVGF